VDGSRCNGWNTKSAKSCAHFTCCARGKGESQNLLRIHRSNSGCICDAVRDGTSLTRSSTCDNTDWSTSCQRYGALIIIERFQNCRGIKRAAI
jgi:hypothetical protein